MLLDDYTKLKRLLDQQKSEADQIRGSIAEVEAGLKRDYGYNTLQEAEDAMEDLRDKEYILERQIKEAYDRLLEEHKDHPVIKQFIK